LARLKGKIAIVTGGARGIGGASAQLLHEEGATVVIADLDQAGGEKMAASLGSPAISRRTDVTRVEDWSALVADCIERFGRIDVLVNNAGTGAVANVLDETPDVHRGMLDVNLTGVWNGMRAVLPQMIAQGGGSIVNISSIDGLVGVAEMTSYVATKFAVTGMTKSVALEAGRHGVRVNSVHPGYIATPMLAAAPAHLRARIDEAIARQPMARPGEPREIAQAVLFFASDQSSFCTGSSLVVDGGHTAGPYRIPVDPTQ
jgi:3alpha(or 20beta)-hydroxysteroid dehydrogenase